jgi:hypothetical protein
LIKQFSEESLRRITEYLEEDGGFSLGGDDDLGHCHRCGRNGSDFEAEHTVMSMLIGSRVLFGVSTLCSACSDGIDEVLSQKTREVHEDFVRRNFPGVPDNLDIPIGVLGA